MSNRRQSVRLRDFDRYGSCGISHWMFVDRTLGLCVMRVVEQVQLKLCLYFFFQAEDGIRDVAVTGVQTCALPISVRMGDLRRTTPIDTEWGMERGSVIDRYYIDTFLAERSAVIRGHVLEVGDDLDRKSVV